MQRLADLRQIRRADLLAGLDQELGIEAELAAARLADGAQRRHVDAVLTLVVGGAPAIDAIAFGRGLPRIKIVAPFADHAAHDVAMAIGQDRQQRRILAIVRQQIRALADRRLDYPGRKPEFLKCRLQSFHEIGAQGIARQGFLALRLKPDPAVELGKKRSGVKLLTCTCDRVVSGRHDVP